MNALPNETNLSLSIVIPCFNEAEVLPLLKERLASSLDRLQVDWEVVFIDDGSSDSTWEQICALHETEPRFKALALSRNFGHQAAICAGMAQATGALVAIMDADLQDPPELFESCIARIREGYDVVYAVRRKRKESLFKRVSYALFYRLIGKLADIEIPLDAGDFCLMTRQVVNTLLELRERNVFVRGLRAWVGFRQIGIEYERSARIAGDTKYSFRRLVKLATDGLLAFSTVPLRLATYLGFCTVGVSMLLFVFILFWRFGHFNFMGHTSQELPGWTALLVGMLFLGGVQLLILGVVGEYLGRIYNEVKQRPRWVMRESVGLAAKSDADRVLSKID